MPGMCKHTIEMSSPAIPNTPALGFWWYFVKTYPAAPQMSSFVTIPAHPSAFPTEPCIM